jgi:hypothetical protein
MLYIQYLDHEIIPPLPNLSIENTDTIVLDSFETRPEGFFKTKGLINESIHKINSDYG